MTQEIAEGIITEDSLIERINKGIVVLLKGKTKPVLLGNGALVKVNTNIGVSDEDAFAIEWNKLQIINTIGFKPDIMMDHTIIHLKKPFWKTMVNNFDGPVGTLPHYLSFSPDKGIDESELMERIEEMLEEGVSFMTLHPTPTLKLYETACKSRIIPSTSRGGSIIIQDMIKNNRDENVISKNFTKIMMLFKKHNVVVSIGTTFRPANISEALDIPHLEETKLQAHFIQEAKRNGVQVMMEGIGHIRLGDLKKYSEIIGELNVPFMPLGPIPTDSTAGFDHVTAAIGSAYMGMMGSAHIFNSITKEEHTGGVPTTESIIEGLKAARVAAHCVNVSMFETVAAIDKEVAENRAKHKTCVVGGGIFSQTVMTTTSMGCNRCRQECPLTVIKNEMEDQNV